MAKLTTSMRSAIPSSKFGLPGSRKYPMPDKAHASNAKARATQQVSKGNLSPASAARIRMKANKVLGAVIVLALILLPLQARAAVTTYQITIGAANTQISTTALYCNWVVFQDNAAHNMRIGDSNISSTRGIALVSGGGAFYQGVKPTGGATNLSNWYVNGTQNDVIDVVCDVTNF